MYLDFNDPPCIVLDTFIILYDIQYLSCIEKIVKEGPTPHVTYLAVIILAVKRSTSTRCIF